MCFYNISMYIYIYIYILREEEDKNDFFMKVVVFMNVKP